MTVELKPCPFCEGAAEMREWDWPYIRFQARCSKCRATPSGRKALRCVAVDAWNTRASHPNHQGQSPGEGVEARLKAAEYAAKSWQQACEQANAREERYEAALKPFADAADRYDDCEQHPNGCPDSAQAGEMVDLTVGDFRRALAALQPNKEMGR